MKNVDNKKQIFLGVVVASILLVGVVLASVMAVVALCFLMVGYTLSVEVLGVVWATTLALWLAGSLPVAKYIDPNMFVLGFVVFLATGFWLLFATVVIPTYGTVGLPIVFAALLGGTFLSLILKFSGLIPEENESEKAETK